MRLTWVAMAAVPLLFIIGGIATIEPRLALGAIIVFLLAVLVLIRFRPVHSLTPTHRMVPDWIVVLLPTALAIRVFSVKASLLVIGLLVVVAFVRKSDVRYQFQFGPLLLLCGAAGIVFSRPGNIEPPLMFLLVGTLVIRLVITTDARRMITSLIDGCGLYLVVNVVCFAAGLQSPAAPDRIGGLAESSGFVRIIYPLTSALNTPPTIAAIYLVASVFLILERGWLRRSLRLTCAAAAVLVLLSAGTRGPLAAAVVLALIVICFPFVTRGIAQAATILAATSALILPGIITSGQSVIAPLVSLTPGRDVRAGSVASLNNRDFIWDRSIEYWLEWVDGLPRMLTGFGVNGQYRSGASMIYRDRIASIVRNPELATMHNSFLQQLFDGGLLGWLLLVASAYWASARLAKRRREWGNAALIAITAMTCLLLSGMTEVSMAPGPAQDTFWVLIVLIGVACQTGGCRADRSGPPRQPRSTNDDEFTRDQDAIRNISCETSASKTGAASETETRALPLR